MVFLQVHAAERRQPQSGVPQGIAIVQKASTIGQRDLPFPHGCGGLKLHAAVGFAEGLDEANQHKVSVTSGSPPEASANAT